MTGGNRDKISLSLWERWHAKRDGEGTMETRPIRKNGKLLNTAKALRRTMTRQERHLWYDFLQHYPVKIYKQRIIADYIVDFYCHSARLIIELDGSQHYMPEGAAYDEARTAVFRRFGLQVIRFSNADVNENFEGVCMAIDECIRQRIDTESDLPSHPAAPGALPEGEPF